jgi:hypothetical protein
MPSFTAVATGKRIGLGHTIHAERAFAPPQAARLIY